MSKSAKSQLTASPAKKQLPNKALSPIGNRKKKNQPDPASKQSRVIAMLRSPGGTTIVAMMKATDWQQHSVRGFLAGVVRKRLKLKLESQAVDGKRFYRIVGNSEKPTKTKRPSA